jgi:hypothetical protein
MSSWITRYGVPQQILTDRGTNFLSELAYAFYKAFGINKLNTTAYRPEGNGANERSHAELRSFFAEYLDGHSPSQWRFLLNDARYSYNTAHHMALGMSPYEAVFAEKPPLGLLGIPQQEESHQDSFEKYYGMHRREVVKRRKMVQERLDKAQEMGQKARNKYSHKIPYQKGDWVMVKNNRLKHKWDLKYTGPWEIAERISPVVFDIEMERGRVAVHAAQLKPYYGKIPPDPPDHQRPDVHNLPELDDQQNYWIEANETESAPQNQPSPYYSVDSSEEDGENSELDNGQETAQLLPNNYPASPQGGAITSQPTSRGSSPLKSVRRLFNRTRRRLVELPPLNITDRPQRQRRPPQFYHDEQ